MYFFETKIDPFCQLRLYFLLLGYFSQTASGVARGVKGTAIPVKANEKHLTEVFICYTMMLLIEGGGPKTYPSIMVGGGGGVKLVRIQRIYKKKKVEKLIF